MLFGSRAAAAGGRRPAPPRRRDPPRAGSRFCIGAGFVTPMLVDRRARRRSRSRGRATRQRHRLHPGPLLSALAAALAGRAWSLVALSLPLFAAGPRAVALRAAASMAVLERPRASTVFAGPCRLRDPAPLTRSFETHSRAEIRRDHTATSSPRRRPAKSSCSSTDRHHEGDARHKMMPLPARRPRPSAARRARRGAGMGTTFAPSRPGTSGDGGGAGV